MESFFHKPKTMEMNIDYLTGLYNRRGLSEIWESLSENAKVHCLYIDVDNFKMVNDIYGHAKGDRLLVFISALLKKTFEGQLIVRMGGDEFVVFCSGTMGISDVEKRLLFLQEALSQGDFDVTIEKLLSFSIGVSYSQQVKIGMNTILEQADVAMYQVKKCGKGNYVVYEEIRERIETEKAIKERALSGEAWEEIEVLYRPVIYIQTSDVYAVEAAAQWDFPGIGMLTEEKFMPVFKQYGIDVQMDAFILEKICRQKAEWKNSELTTLEFYVKLSGRYLLQKDSMSAIARCLEKYQVELEEIEICVDEKDFWENGEKLYSVAQQMIKEGFRVAIHDFASASSLSVLQRVPSQMLKLDAKLLAEAGHSNTGVCILRNVISLGRDLHCGIVAQGIENAAQVEMLANYGAQFGIGNFYGKPCDAEAFAKQYGSRLFFVHNKRPTVFPFAGNLEDADGQCRGTFSGTGFSYAAGVVEGQSALYFPGGEVKENVVLLPKEVMYSDSYSICFWINPDADQPWTSIFYMTYMDGFMSLMPTSGHGDMFFRIKDDREPNEWHDIMCRKAVPGQWSYICATYDVITHIGKLYFNGLLVGSREKMANLKAVDKIMLGGDEYQNSFEGRLAGLEIYHYVLSAQQIEESFRKYQSMPSFLGTDGRK